MNDENEWIAWGGGECPVSEGQTFERRFRNGQMLGPLSAWHGNMRALVWQRFDDPFDIIAYRIVR